MRSLFGTASGLHPLLPVSWRHAYGYAPPGYGYHHDFGGGFIGHMVVSSIVHGLVSHLGLGGALLLAVLVIGGLSMWRRRYRGW